jgi:hypothetical protein
VFEVQLMFYRTKLGSKAVVYMEVLARTNGERALNACDIDNRKRQMVQTFIVACSEAGVEAHSVGSLGHITQIAKSNVDVACLFPCSCVSDWPAPSESRTRATHRRKICHTI